MCQWVSEFRPNLRGLAQEARVRLQDSERDDKVVSRQSSVGQSPVVSRQSLWLCNGVKKWRYERQARSLGIGLLSGGYGLGELERAGAYRMFEDPADLLDHLDEVGGRR